MSQTSLRSYSLKQEEDLLDEEGVNFGGYEVHVDTKYKMNEKVDKEAAEEIDSQKSERIYTHFLPVTDFLSQPYIPNL